MIVYQQIRFLLKKQSLMTLNWTRFYQYGLQSSIRHRSMQIVACTQYFRRLSINLKDKWLSLIANILMLSSAIPMLTLNWRILDLANYMNLFIMKFLERFQKKSTCLLTNWVYFFMQSIDWESMKITATKTRTYKKSNLINSRMYW